MNRGGETLKNTLTISRYLAVLTVGISSFAFADVNLLANESTASSDMARKSSQENSLQSHASQNVSSSFGRLSRVYGLIVDENDSIYALDSMQSVIFKINRYGLKRIFSGTPAESGYRDGPLGIAKFNRPEAIAMDEYGNIFIADGNNRVIRKISSDGLVSTVAGCPHEAGDADGGPQQARINLALGLAISENRSIYFIDFDTVRVLHKNGEIKTIAGSPLPRRSPDVPVDTETDGPGHAVRFNILGGVAISANGNIFVTDSGDSTLRMISPNGTVTTIAGKAMNFGSADGEGRDARFYIPAGIAVDASDNVFVADSGNHTVRKITPEGLVSTFAGDPRESATRDGVGVQARFMVPRGLAFDKYHNLYVADIGCSCLRKIAPNGAVSTIEFSTVSN